MADRSKLETGLAERLAQRPGKRNLLARPSAYFGVTMILAIPSLLMPALAGLFYGAVATFLAGCFLAGRARAMREPDRPPSGHEPQLPHGNSAQLISAARTSARRDDAPSTTEAEGGHGWVMLAILADLALGAALLIGWFIVNAAWTSKAQLCVAEQAYTGQTSGSCTFYRFADGMKPTLLIGGLLFLGIGVLVFLAAMVSAFGSDPTTYTTSEQAPHAQSGPMTRGATGPASRSEGSETRRVSGGPSPVKRR